MAFFGLKVAAGKEVEIEEALSPELYISQVCAPRELEKAERAELWVIPTEEGKSTGYIAAVLRAGQPMASVNLFVDPMTTKFKVKGACDLHLTGYYGAGDPEDDDMSSVDLNEEQEDEKMEDVEPKADEKLKKIEKKSNLVPVMGDTTDEEEMEEEDELESDDELERTVQALNAAQNKTPSKADSKEAEKKVEQKKETSTAAKTQKAEDATAKKSSAPEETKKVAPAEKESDKTGLVDSDSEEEELEEELEEEDIDSDDEMEKKFAAVKEAAKQMEKKEQASESKKEKQTEKKKPAIETVTLKNDKAPAQPETQVESDLSEDEEEEEEEEEDVDPEEVVAMVREARRRGLPVDPKMVAMYEMSLKALGESDAGLMGSEAMNMEMDREEEEEEEEEEESSEEEEEVAPASKKQKIAAAKQNTQGAKGDKKKLGNKK